MTYTDEHIGHSVRIIDVPSKYELQREKLYNAIGIIQEVYGPHIIGIMIEGVINKRSEKNLFWFDDDEITFIETEENNDMNIKSLGKDAKFALLHNPGKDLDASIAVYYGEELRQGDLVVCDYGYKNGALSVRIVAETEIAAPVSCIDCEIMGVADVSAYNERQYKKARRAELKAKMTERAKKYQEEVFWRMVAEQDTDMAELIKEFDAINE